MGVALPQHVDRLLALSSLGGRSALAAVALPALEALAQVAEEAARVRAVDEAVVVGQRDVHHRADRDHVLAERRPATTHGRFTSAYVPRIADCGWLMTGVPWNVP